MTRCSRSSLSSEGAPRNLRTTNKAQRRQQLSIARMSRTDGTTFHSHLPPTPHSHVHP